LVAELGLTGRVPLITASLAKAFAGRAGAVLGDERCIEYLKYEALPSIFSSALLPSDLAALNETLTVIKTADMERGRLRRHAATLKQGLQTLGYNVADSDSQIISLEPGPEQNTMVLRDALESRGIFGAVFCAPATPRNRSIIRFSVSADLGLGEIERVLNVCEAVRGEVGMAAWPSTRRLAKRGSSAGNLAHAA
jgi:CAI-1 autoinducer synthase